MDGMTWLISERPFVKDLAKTLTREMAAIVPG